MAASGDDPISARPDGGVPVSDRVEPDAHRRRPPALRVLAVIVALAVVGGLSSALAAGPLQPTVPAQTPAPLMESGSAGNQPQPSPEPGSGGVGAAAELSDATHYRGELPASPEGTGGPGPETTSLPLGPSEPFALTVPVLTYHRIDPVAAADEYVVRPALFDAHLRALWTRGWRSITAHDLGILLATRTRPAPRTFVVTIDDGWLDGLTWAEPILQRYGDVATYFVVPDLVATDRYLSWDEVRTLHARGMEIGNHTRDHPHLPQLSATEIAAEIGDAQVAIASQLGAEPDSFAYPFGQFNDAVVEAVRKAALLIGFTTQTGVTASWPSRLTTPRIHVGARMSVDQLLRAMGASL